MKKYKEFLESVGKFVNVDYKIIIKNYKSDIPEILIMEFNIIRHEDKKMIIKAKGYIKTELNGYNDGKKKSQWIEFDDFKDDKTRTVWNKNFENGTKRIKVYN